MNARLLTGDLEAWRQFAVEQELANTGGVLTIYHLNGAWLSWGTDVDVARGAVAGDTTFRTFLTGPDEYGQPRWTNFAMATAGSQPYPVETRPLGVPPPDTAPTVAPGVDPNPSSFAIDVLDDGSTLATNWTNSLPVNQATFSSNVTQDAIVGNPAPSYKMAWRDQEVGTNLRRNFGIANANAVTFTVDWQMSLVADINLFWAGVQRDEDGAGVSIQVSSAAGDWRLSIGTGASWAQGWGQSTLKGSDSLVGLAADTWYRLKVTTVTNTDGTRTVTASVLTTADVEIGTIATQVDAPKGDWCGFGGGFDQLGVVQTTNLDNVRVQATGSTGYNPVETATSYVYTFVDDVGEESAPSFASATVLRPDGVTITVTTPTDTPVGTDAAYGITTKRIYRAATGATGAFFRFVAEIPLATADYVDSLPDTELGETLQSDLWALPPDDLRGMLALPNGVMVGFSKNQLCFSAQNHPHAWPVEYRLTVDTDIVAVGNIDTTVVIGTKNFIYLAIGTDPAAYSMTKLEVPQACVAKRSLAYLIGIGVVFASPDGLIAVAGNGNVRNLTSSTFTREQWQARRPESIIGVAHDDVYHFFYDTTPPTPEEHDVLVLDLDSTINGDYNDTSLDTSAFDVTPLTVSDYADYNDSTDNIEITQTGVYEVTITAAIIDVYSHLKSNATIAGIRNVPDAMLGDSRHLLAGPGSAGLGPIAPGHETFTDQFILRVEELPFTFNPALYAHSYTDYNSAYTAKMTIVVRRSGDLTP